MFRTEKIQIRMFLTVLWIFVWAHAQESCKNNEFQEFGYWFKCQASWATCDKYSECTSCVEHFTYNGNILILK